MTKRIYYIIYFIILVISNQAFSQANKTHSPFGYSFIIQPGWHIISDAVCKKRIEELKKMNATPPSFEYALALTTANFPFERPYIIIRHLKTGKLSQADIEKMIQPFKSQASLESIKKEVDGMTNGIVTPTKVNDVYYDKLNKTIHLVSVTDVKDLGLVINYQACVLTNYGYVQFVGSSLIENFDKIVTTFNNFIKSISVDAEYKYY